MEIQTDLDNNSQLQDKILLLSNKFYNIFKRINQLEIWTQLAVVTSILEYIFQRVPLVSIPAVILDVGGSFGNLFNHSHYKNVKFSDITGLASSFASVVGTFSMSASLGIEATLIGARLIKIANITTPIGFGLFALGYIMDHHHEIKEYARKEYNQFKASYNLENTDFFDANPIITPNTQNNLINTLSESFQIDLANVLPNEFQEFEKIELLKTGELIDLKDDTSSLTELVFTDQTISDKKQNLEEINDPNFSFINENESIPKLENIPQELFLSVDIGSNNLELLHLTKDDLRNSPLYIRTIAPPLTYYENKDLPWLDKHSHFREYNDKFYFIDHIGINRGVIFPLFYDKTTKLPLGLPLDINSSFQEMDALDVLKHSPHLFEEPGHVYNNMALQKHIFHKAAVQGSFNHNHLSTGAIQGRLQELKIIQTKDVLKIESKEIKGLNENINQNDQITLSPISGNSREGKYCFRYDDIDTSEMIDPTGNNQKIIVEICFDKNPYVFE